MNFVYEAQLMERKKNRNPIYDGDTIWLRVRKALRWEVDFGFHINFTIDIGLSYGLKACRLYGIDTPEVNRRASREAGLKARDFVRAALEPLDWFRVETFKDHEKGKYGRYLVKVFLPDGRCLNDVLVAEGLAEQKDY